MTDLTDERLEEIRALAEAATPGEWHVSHSGRYVKATIGSPWICEADCSEKRWRENMAFIAVAKPATVLDLLDAITSTRERAEKAEKELAQSRPWPISIDGPTPLSDQRLWLARKLLDSKLPDDVAFEIVVFHPNVSDLWRGRADAEERARKRLTGLHDKAVGDLAETTERATAAEALLREAGEVVEPFASFADALSEECPDNIALGIFAGGGMQFGPTGENVNVGALRAARALAAKLKAGVGW